MANLKDIAKLAGVSHTAVSQVINGKGRVSERKREEILQLCEKHNYRPNFTARSLQSQRTGVIGVIVNFFGNPFFSEIIKGIENIALENNYVLLFGDSREDHERESMYVDTFLERRVDGIILYPTFSNEFENDLVKLNKFEVPFILVDKFSENISTNYVACDDFEAGYIAADHLVKKGHKHIGYVGGPSCSSMNGRINGFKKALVDSALPIDETLFATFNISKEHNLINGYDAAKKLLTNSIKISAIFSTTDEAIPGIMKALREAKLNTPDDIAIVSLGNMPGIVNEDVPITSINYPQVEVGEEATRILIDLIHNKSQANKIQQVLLKPKLVIRESSGVNIC
jgi:DNA-binding LacI/PurR family transcriptional regulator